MYKKFIYGRILLKKNIRIFIQGDFFVFPSFGWKKFVFSTTHYKTQSRNT